MKDYLYLSTQMNGAIKRLYYYELKSVIQSVVLNISMSKVGVIPLRLIFEQMKSITLHSFRLIESHDLLVLSYTNISPECHNIAVVSASQKI